MTIQDHINCPDSSTLLHEGNGILLDAGVESTTEGHHPKIRKPYTMTKQRERWTEDEHKKFLGALKLYGRAWRKIEEHVGTKTAVQIRSHAQKFFSKVVRESDNSVSCSIKPIEIPPPRPKRKPMHPYPRKFVTHVKKDVPLHEQSGRSASPNSSLDQEDQSPTSVLSAVVSDALGSANSSTRESSSLPVSSHRIVDHWVHSPYEGRPTVQENVSQMDKPVSMKLELVPMVSALTQEGTVDTTLPKVFKLFGKTVLLGISEKTSFSSPCKEQKLSTHSVDLAEQNDEKSLNKPSPMEVGPSAPVPLRAFSGGMPFSFIPFDNMNSIKEEVQEKEIKNEGSLPGLNAGLVNAPGNCVRKWDTETQSHQYPVESTGSQQSLAPVIPHSNLRPNLKRSSSENRMRAFVPYKRSLSERVAHSLTMTGEEGDPPRTRLCL